MDIDHQQLRSAVEQLRQRRAERGQAEVLRLREVARAAILANDPQRADAAVRALLGRTPEDARWWLELARIRLRAGDSAGALDAIGPALRNARRHVDRLLAAGRLLRQAAPSAGMRDPLLATIDEPSGWPSGTSALIVDGSCLLYTSPSPRD